MRKSHIGLNKNYIRKDSYKGLPTELQEFNYYYADGETGHVIMAIPKCLLAEAQKGDMDMYECPVPCRYVLEHGYEMLDSHVIVDVPYGMFGVEVDEKYMEI